MYVTAHHVSNEHKTGINAFIHKHGEAFCWPDEPWRLPETEPGAMVGDKVQVKPGGNAVHSYLDVLSPDDVSPDEIGAALIGLWLELLTDEAAPGSPAGLLPNPVVYRRGRVVLRFGVEEWRVPTRSLEFAELRQYVDPATATWREISPPRT